MGFCHWVQTLLMVKLWPFFLRTKVLLFFLKEEVHITPSNFTRSLNFKPDLQNRLIYPLARTRLVSRPPVSYPSLAD